MATRTTTGTRGIGRLPATLALLAGLAAALAGCASSAPAARKDAAARGKPPATRRPALATGATAASQRCSELMPLIARVSQETEVELAMLVGILRTESNFRNDVRSRVGAQGLAQVMPSTARAKKCGDLGDPYQNVLCGARVLKGFVEYYRGDLILGLSGYNAGHAMPNQARRTRELPANTDYVEKVLWARARFLDRGCDF
ncbi:MAG TPA: transglycosylase SLT domain-containing protein [Myxococcota bacterium]|jgi:soluble lytic murein transglycosylase-like protein|nr:transglycosylase SLT domain-containing protein [Myxococcota bacterium]